MFYVRSTMYNVWSTIFAKNVKYLQKEFVSCNSLVNIKRKNYVLFIYNFQIKICSKVNNIPDSYIIFIFAEWFLMKNEQFALQF